MIAVKLGHVHLHFDSIPSTQDWLAANWSRWPDGFLVTAHTQTAGRGQAGRTWLTAAGLNFTGSFLLRNCLGLADRPFQLNKAAALAVRDAVVQLLDSASGIEVKWPNDVLARGRKLAGVLPQLVWRGPRLEAVLLGIGLNVNQAAFAPELAGRATSLVLLAKRLFDLAHVTEALCQKLAQRLQQIEMAPVRLDIDFLACLHRYQEWASYRYRSQNVTACIVGVDCSGRLVLESAGGLLRVQPQEIEYV